MRQTGRSLAFQVHAFSGWPSKTIRRPVDGELELRKGMLSSAGDTGE